MDTETWTRRHGIKILGNSEVSQKKLNGKWKTEAQAIFLNPFTVCSSCKRKFVVCLFVWTETNESYPLANGLNVLNGLSRLNGLTHLWVSPCIVFMLSTPEKIVTNPWNHSFLQSNDRTKKPDCGRQRWPVSLILYIYATMPPSRGCGISPIQSEQLGTQKKPWAGVIHALVVSPCFYLCYLHKTMTMKTYSKIEQ
jgi:hypothetical protein